MNVTGTDFVLVMTQDLERAERFYTQTLGLELGKRWGDMGFEVETGGVTVALMDAAKAGREFRPSPTAVVLRVDDPTSLRSEAAPKAELEADGVEFGTDVIDSGTCHQAYFADPDGNALGIHHVYAAR